MSKRINTYKKGQIAEHDFEKLCLDGGDFILSYKAPHVMFSNQHDIFNAFDGLALTKDGKLLFWQLKSGKSPSNYYSAKKKIDSISKVLNHIEKVEIRLIYINKGKNHMKIYDGIQQKEIYDGKYEKE